MTTPSQADQQPAGSAPQGSGPATPAPQAPVALQTSGSEPLTAPATPEDVRALRIRRSELSDQLISATDRRDQLVSELRNVPAPAQSGLVARIHLLDGRIIQLETDIATTGRLLTDAPSGALVSSAAPPFVPPGGGPDWSAAGMAAMFIVLIPLVFVISRLIWKRGSAQKRVATSTVGKDAADQMARVEQAVDAIALEVERISEGQRFLTKIMTERPVADGVERVAALSGGGQAPGTKR
jgi:Na+-transporting methylmalonyl-CoA/oxaloacetate decarboxylase gamma subunit